MSVVQASLRSQAGSVPPRDLVASMPGAINGPGGGGRCGNGGGGVAVAPTEATLVRLKTGGLVIGAMPATTYEQERVDLASGDLLLAYTDGITEALSLTGEEFGEQRLWEAVAASAHLPAAEMAEAIVASVRRFCGDAPQYDDITLVAARVR
jgi:serine phosphatase RsbU (regulator of sigma subunit)